MSTLPFDRAILSTNEDALYLDFWPIVSWAYKALGIPCELIFLTERQEDDPFVTRLREHGKVTLQPPVNMIPQSAQAKLCRYWQAMQYDDVSYVDDIDLLPLSREWILSKTQDRPKDHLLLVGREVYGTTQVPASQMTAEGHVWRALFNPQGLGWRAWLESLKGYPGHANIESRAYHEGYSYSTDQAELGQPLFSDEALLVHLRKIHPVPEFHVTRDAHPGIHTVDRDGWNIDADKLWKGGYFSAHLIRPYKEHKNSIAKVLSALQELTGADPWPTWIPMSHAPHISPEMNFGGSGMTQEGFEWIFANIPTGEMVLEFGAGLISTNWLSRFYNLYSVEDRLQWVNLFPARYIYAPRPEGSDWYDPDIIRGWAEDAKRRGWRYGLVIVDGPWQGDRRKIIEHLDLFDLSVPWMIDDTERNEEQQLAQAVSERAGRPIQNYGQFSII